MPVTWRKYSNYYYPGTCLDCIHMDVVSEADTQVCKRKQDYVTDNEMSEPPEVDVNGCCEYFIVSQSARASAARWRELEERRLKRDLAKKK